MLTVSISGGGDSQQQQHVNFALDETIDGAQLSLYTCENALLRHIGTHASICINASNRAHVMLTVNRAISATNTSLALCASSGARIDCVLPPVAYAPTMPLACAYVLIQCEGFDSVVDLHNAFDVQRAIVVQSGKSSRVCNFSVGESIHTRLEEPTNLVNVVIDPARGCRHELLSSNKACAARVFVNINHPHSHESAADF